MRTWGVLPSASSFCGPAGECECVCVCVCVYVPTCAIVWSDGLVVSTQCLHSSVGVSSLKNFFTFSNVVIN